MQEEEALAETPERSRAELVRTRRPLVNAVRQTRAHMVKREVRERAVSQVRDTGER